MVQECEVDLGEEARAMFVGTQGYYPTRGRWLPGAPILLPVWSKHCKICRGSFSSRPHYSSYPIK